MRSLVISMLIILLGQGCIKPPDYPDEPVIEMLGISKDSLVQSEFNIDSVYVVFSFTDGDGDLGSNDSLNIFVTDLRDNFLANKFRIPFVREQGSNNGISGEIQILIYTTCCTYPDTTPACDASTEFPTNDLQYEIYIKDRAGNESNRITTPPITLLCR